MQKFRKNCIFIQKEFSSCGACSVESVVSFYGGYVPHETVLEDTFTNRYGTNAFNLIRALKKYGFDSYGVKKNLVDLSNQNLPVIAHVVIDSFEHFLVIYRITKNYVITMDPRCGYKKYGIDNFNQIFDGIVLIIRPIAKIVKYNKSKSLKVTFLGNIDRYKKKFIFSFIISLILIELSLITSIYLKVGIEYKNLTLITIVFMILIILKYTIGYFENKMFFKLSHDFNIRINRSVLSHIFKLNLRYLNNKRVGEITNRLDEINYINQWILKLLVMDFIDLLLCLISLILVFIINSTFGLVLSIMFVFGTVTTIYFSKKFYPKECELIDLSNAYYGNLTESLSMIESVKNLNEENYFENKLHNSLCKMEETKLKYCLLKQRLKNIRDCLFEVGIILCNTFGILSIRNGNIDLVSLVTINSIFSLCFSSYNNLMTSISSFFHVLASHREINEFLDIEEENNSVIIKNNFHLITLNNVNYSYDNYKMILKNLNLNIHFGDKILVTGSSGSGKSTFVKLLCGNLDSYDGSIKFDDIELFDLSVRTVRDMIVYVGQSEKLFTGTILENITFSKQTDTDISTIEKMSGLEKMFSSGLNFDTLLLEDGGNISCGEKARIIVARALFKKPKVLIIDETLSNVERSLEEEILDNLLANNELTLIYITHREWNNKFKKIINFRKDGCYDLKGF